MDSESKEVVTHVLPLYRGEKYKFATTLNGELFNFKVSYNRKASKFFLSVYDGAMSPISLGIGLLPNKVFSLNRVSDTGFFMLYEKYGISEEDIHDPYFLLDRCTMYFFDRKTK